jgi:hypothetical protein
MGSRSRVERGNISLREEKSGTTDESRDWLDVEKEKDIVRMKT